MCCHEQFPKSSGIVCEWVSEQPEKRVLFYGIHCFQSMCVLGVSSYALNSHLCSPTEIIPCLHILDPPDSCSDAEVESEETLEED